MISDLWQRRRISAYLFCVVHGPAYNMISADPLLLHWEVGNPPKLPAEILLLIASRKLSSYRQLDLIRSATVWNPCRTEADYSHLRYLIKLHYDERIRHLGWCNYPDECRTDPVLEHGRQEV